MKSAFLIPLGLAATFIISAGCGKKVVLPDAKLAALFGSWQWTESYCGWSGRSTPEGQVVTLEFTENGYCIPKTDGKEKNKMKFTVTEGTSMLTNDKAYFLELDDRGIFNKNTSLVRQILTFAGRDTLFLNADANDGCGSTYIRID